MENYYAIVGADRNDPADLIKKKLNLEFRRWQKRTNSSDLSVRQEAEKQVALLTKAREILLDDIRRQTYDQQLAAFLNAGGGAQATVAPQGGTGDWLQQARDYLARGDYNSAAYCAREARNTLGASAEVWSLLARANSGLGNLNEAVYEAQQATSLDPGNPERHLELADVYEDLEQWDRALVSFEQVNRLTGGSEIADLGIAGSLAAMGRFGEAIPVLEKLHQTGSNKRMAAYYLADVLLAHAETVPRSRDGESYMVTTAEELIQMRAILERVKTISDDPEIVPRVLDLDQYLTACEMRRLYQITGWKVAKTVILWLIIAAAIAAILGQSGGAGLVLGTLLGCGLAWLRIYILMRMYYLPQWRINALLLQRGY